MSQENNDNNDIKDKSFEKALSELETIVKQLESGQVELAKSIEIYERAELLKSHCENLLKSAEEKIEKIVVSQDGTIGVTDLD